MTVPVTLIIPTYERSGLLATSLARLAELTVPEQIIVVDDGGHDDTQNVCEASALSVQYIRIDHPGSTTPCRARNVGLRFARHELVLTTEPEVIFETDVIQQMLAFELAGRCVLCEGRATSGDEQGNRSAAGPVYVHLYRRDWLLDVGGWDEGFPDPWGWDDVDLHTRLDIGLGIGHPNAVPGSVVHHQYHPTRLHDGGEDNEAYFRAKQFPRDLVANR